MECQILFSLKYKKNIINLSSAELAQRVAKVKYSTVILVFRSSLVWVYIVSLANSLLGST